MRLIDADNFLERFEKMCETETDNVIAMVLRGALVDEPTAYDVDKVVEQIYKEQEREFINNEVAIGDITCSEVIEIVKGGGVDE